MNAVRAGHLEWSIKLLFPIKTALQKVYDPPKNVLTAQVPGEDVLSRRADCPRIQNHPKSVTARRAQCRTRKEMTKLVDVRSRRR